MYNTYQGIMSVIPLIVLDTMYVLCGDKIISTFLPYVP